MSKFLEREAGEDKSDKSCGKVRSRTFGSLSGRPGWKKTPKIRGATGVLTKVASLDTGVVELVFPKEAEDLCEDIKQNLRVGGIRVCHWHPGAGVTVWSNMSRDSQAKKPTLNCSPLPCPTPQWKMPGPRFFVHTPLFGPTEDNGLLPVQYNSTSFGLGSKMQHSNRLLLDAPTTFPLTALSFVVEQALLEALARHSRRPCST